MSTNQHTETKPDRKETGGEFGASLARRAGPWWLLLLTGIAWLIISMVVLRFSMASAVTIGVLLGVAFLAATVNEFLIASVRWQWGWAHALTGFDLPRRGDLVRLPERTAAAAPVTVAQAAQPRVC